MAILSQLIGELTNQHDMQRSPSSFRTRDLNIIYEARDYLAQHFVAPPPISQLARLVGINQTKLKAGFRAIVGMTIYEYVLQQRMARASELLASGSYSVSEVAYRIGYNYPGNFTCAFRKHFGQLPRTWHHPGQRRTGLKRNKALA